MGGSGAQAQEPAQFFPYGAIHMSTISHWQHYLPPVKEWLAYMEKDLLNMKEVRFNTLVVHVDWFDIETAPGRFEFERLDGLMDLVDKHSMKALLWPWPEMQPEWLLDLYPDGEWIASDGHHPGSVCWDHPGMRNMVERFIEKTVVRYRDRSSVIGWDVGAEAGIWVAEIGNPIDRALRLAALLLLPVHRAPLSRVAPPQIRRDREAERNLGDALRRLVPDPAGTHGGFREGADLLDRLARVHAVEHDRLPAPQGRDGEAPRHAPSRHGALGRLGRRIRDACRR